jgi:hypothetical protein
MVVEQSRDHSPHDHKDIAAGVWRGHRDYNAIGSLHLRPPTLSTRSHVVLEHCRPSFQAANCPKMVHVLRLDILEQCIVIGLAPVVVVHRKKTLGVVGGGEGISTAMTQRASAEAPASGKQGRNYLLANNTAATSMLGALL